MVIMVMVMAMMVKMDMLMMVDDSNLGEEGEDDSDSGQFGDLCAVDSKVAGAVEDDQEMGERSTDCHFRTPDVDS